VHHRRGGSVGGTWGAITGPWWSLGAPARSAGHRLSVDSTAGRPYESLCRCGGLFRQHISWMETALLGRFQPQTEQTGRFASRKYSPLGKEVVELLSIGTCSSICSPSHVTYPDCAVLVELCYPCLYISSLCALFASVVVALCHF
jgi:hypothetical protein